MKRILVFGVLALAAVAPARADVIIRAPFVYVEVGPAVVVRAPFVNIVIPRRPALPPAQVIDPGPPPVPQVPEVPQVPGPQQAAGRPVTPAEFVANFKRFKP